MANIAIIDDDVYIGNMLEELLKKRDMGLCAPTPGQRR